jgi:hypothetical protein
MSQFFNMRISQSALVAQSALIGKMLTTLRAGSTLTIDASNKTAIAALAGLENLLDEIAVQMDAPEHSDRPDPFTMRRSELSDFYRDTTGDSLDGAFGSSEWDTFDGQEFVANYLDSLDD